MPADVRLAGPDDIGAMAVGLGRAFADDPVFEFLTPHLTVEERARRVVPFFRTEVRQRAREATAWCSSAQEGSALWAAPAKWRTGGMDGVRIAAAIIRGGGLRAVPAMGAMLQLEKVHPREPHWYLGVLGTDPDHQGKGIGAALLEPTLERCDREGLPAYLESSKASNVPYYERFGWRTTQELTLGKPGTGGPIVYLMWRDPS